MAVEFYRPILENPQVQNLMNIRPVWTELFHSDRQKRMDGRMDRQMWQNNLSLFAILRLHLKNKVTWNVKQIRFLLW
jgi:hypothetical protein